MRRVFKLTASLLAVCLLCLLVATPAQARIIETSVKVSVKLQNGAEKPVAQDIGVTVFYDSETATPRPLLVLNHGRSGLAEERAALRVGSGTERVVTGVAACEALVDREAHAVSRWALASGGAICTAGRPGRHCNALQGSLRFSRIARGPVSELAR